MKKIMSFIDKYLPRVWGTLIVILFLLLTLVAVIGVGKLILVLLGVI